MQSVLTSKKLFRLGLLLVLLASALEVQIWLSADGSNIVWYSHTGMIAVIVAAILLLISLLLAVLRWKGSAYLVKLAMQLPRSIRLRGVAVIGAVTAFTWMFLFSAWQFSFPGPWTRFLIACALAYLLAFLTVGLESEIGWREVIVALGLFVYTGSMAEFRTLFPTGLVSSIVFLPGYWLLIGLVAFLYSKYRFSLKKRLMGWRPGLQWWARAVFMGLFFLLPLIVRFAFPPSFYALNPNLRFVFLVTALLVATFFLTTDSDRLFSWDALLVSSGILFAVSVLAGYTYLVSTYPFSLSWSEGNRLYDYSLIFSQKIYQYSGYISNPYNSPARYVLWGLPFLLPGSTIGVNRLWAVILRVLPAFLFGWFVSAGIKETKFRWGIAFWVFLLFVVPTTIYAPILLAATLVVIFAFQPSLLLRLVVVVIAGVYASLSRWTWSLAPAAWAALIDLFLYYPQRRPPLFQKILPTALLAMLGAAAGLVLGQRSLFNYVTSESFVSSQPLLWYRLFPNETYSLGIILGTLITTGPLLAVLFWWMSSHTWRLDWIQRLAIWGTLLGFLGAGWFASAKIGGGSNPHNLDMYFISLALIFCMGVYFLWKENRLQVTSWPSWIKAMLCWYIMLIAYRFTPFQSADVPATLQLPSPTHAQQTLDIIRVQALQASRSGEVLFMDQRQLITFGYVTGFPFVPDYEKKYMMDQALASNSGYYKQYYLDLSRRRFSLIVTEPLKLNLKGQNTAPFSEENDSWVRWVSRPTLCFYKPIFTDPDVGVQLLVPRKDPSSCNKYLIGG